MRHRRVVLAADVAVAVLAAVVAWVVQPDHVGVVGVLPVVVGAIGCPVVFGLRGFYGRRHVGSPRQLRALLRTLAAVGGAIALVGAMTALELTHRSFIAAAVMLVAGFVTTRLIMKRRLTAMRRDGRAVHRTVAVGTAAEISRLVDQFAKATGHPFVVVGACVEDDGTLVEDVPLLARMPVGADGPDPLRQNRSVQAVVKAALSVGADTVCVVASSRFTGDRLRALGWALDDRRVTMVTALGVVDVAEHRIRLSRAGGVSLLEIESVRPTRVRRIVKNVLDRVAAALLLVLLAPVLLVASVLVRRSSPGTVIYRQPRAGRDGATFTMLKFRTMYADADARRSECMADNDGAGPLFKMRDDPRVTPVGRVLRKYSIDELPQLVNVIRGEMSLVGPRPPLLSEVAEYDAVERRRLRAMPGMTGLWQVSGRSNLSWEESVRLDLSYVDNWTVGGDIRVLGRTVGAVVNANGSY